MVPPLILADVVVLADDVGPAQDRVLLHVHGQLAREDFAWREEAHFMFIVCIVCVSWFVCSCLFCLYCYCYCLFVSLFGLREEASVAATVRSSQHLAFFMFRH